jgi:hypothetical protein
VSSYGEPFAGRPGEGRPAREEELSGGGGHVIDASAPLVSGRCGISSVPCRSATFRYGRYGSRDLGRTHGHRRMVDGSELARAQLVGRVYQRITVQDGAIVGVELTEAAKRLGFLAALPETLVMARPAGLEPTTFRSAT